MLSRFAIVLLSLMVAGCMSYAGGGGMQPLLWPAPSGGGASGLFGSAPGSSGGGSQPPSVYNLSGGYKDALKDGCRRRYPTDRGRYLACVRGKRHSADAMIDGCNRRYEGNGEKLRRCLSYAFQ